MNNESTALTFSTPAAITPTRSPYRDYLANLDSDRSKETARNCLRMMAAAVGVDPDRVDEFDWSTLKYEHVLAIRSLLASREKPLAPSTINLILSVVRGIARQCWLLEQMDERTYKLIHTETKGVKGARLPKGRMIPMKDIRKLLRACDDGSRRGKRDAAIIAILLGAGLRRSEVSWLGECVNIASFDFDEHSVKVIGKGNNEREVFLFDGTLDVLKEWIDVWRLFENKPLFPAFTGHTDKPLPRGVSPQAIYAMLRKRCLAAGLVVMKPHDFRRTFISTQLEKSGGDTFAVQKQAGHRDPATTEGYDLRGAKAQKNVASKCSIPL